MTQTHVRKTHRKGWRVLRVYLISVNEVSHYESLRGERMETNVCAVLIVDMSLPAIGLLPSVRRTCTIALNIRVSIRLIFYLYSTFLN